MTPPLVLSALCLALCLCFFLYVRWYIRRNTAIDQLLGEYRSEVFRLIAEIDAATDRDSQLVEDRIQTLKSLLADTDKRIAVYVRELERSKNGEALYSSLGRGVRSALRQGQPETAKPAPAGERTAPAALPPAAEPAPAAEQPPPAPALPVKKRPARSPHSGEAPAELFENTPASPLRLQAQIAALAAEGHSPSLIASRLNIDRSEVELALNLRNWK